MTTAQQTLLQLLAAALHPSIPAPAVSEELWPEIKAELAAQTVLPIVQAENLLSGDKTEAIIAVGTNVGSFHRLMQTETAVVSLLSPVFPVVLKGAAAAQYYPHPEYRQMGDIDLLVPPENYDAAFSLLEQNGFRHLPKEGYERHASFRAESGVEVELHRYFTDSPKRKLDQRIFREIRRAEKRLVCGYPVPVLPDETNGLVLLEHIHHHLSGGLGLRQIVDWMKFAEAVLTDEKAWEDYRQGANAVGLGRLLEAVALLCRNYLGFRPAFPCEGDEETAKELMEYVLDKGNFGKKQERISHKTVTIVHAFRSPAALFSYLQTSGLFNWKAARNHKLLRPFAWIYQIGHLLCKGIGRKASPETFINEFKTGEREAKLLKKLE